MKIMLLLAAVQVAAAQFGFRSTGLPQDTLAVVGGRPVTARDYLERFELMPWPQKENTARQEYTKKEFLYSLVAEKLLALEASEQGLGEDSVSLAIQRNLSRMFVRDEFYKQSVLPNVKISAAEMREGLKRFGSELEVEILGILSREEGELLRKKVRQARNKRAVLRKYLDSLYVPVDTVQIGFGSADRALEEAAFAISADSLSAPVESKVYGLVMARLLKRYSNPQASKFSGQDQLTKVKNVISQRKEDSLAVVAFASVTAPHRAEADGALFHRLADTVHRRMSADSAAYRTKNVYLLTVALLDEIDRELGADRDRPFVTFDAGEPMTFAEVVQGLRNNYIVFPNMRREYVEWVLNNNIKTVIQNELLAREGMRRNLQQSESVRHDLATWMDNRKGMLLLRRVADSVTVTEREIDEEYQRSPSAYGAAVEVRIRQIITDSLVLAKNLRERLKRGEPFAVLAKGHSTDAASAARGGETGFFDLRSRPDIAPFLASSLLGEVEGPYRSKNGFIIYTVLERRVHDDSLRADFGPVRERIRAQLAQRKRQQTLDRFIGTLARKYDVTIDEAALGRVETTQHSMVTWRHIGFGGRMIAVPQTNRQTEWIYEWRRQERLNQ